MKFLKSLLSDERGMVSSKRLIAIICVVILCAALIYTISCPECKSPSEVIVDGIKYICCVSLGSSSVDKFSFKKDTGGTENA
jgi:hypothetical protein